MSTKQDYPYTLETDDFQSIVAALATYDIDQTTAMALAETGSGAFHAWTKCDSEVDPRKAVCAEHPDLEVFVTCPKDNGHPSTIQTAATHVRHEDGLRLVLFPRYTSGPERGWSVWGNRASSLSHERR